MDNLQETQKAYSHSGNQKHNHNHNRNCSHDPEHEESSTSQPNEGGTCLAPSPCAATSTTLLSHQVSPFSSNHQHHQHQHQHHQHRSIQLHSQILPMIDSSHSLDPTLAPDSQLEKINTSEAVGASVVKAGMHHQIDTVSSDHSHASTSSQEHTPIFGACFQFGSEISRSSEQENAFKSLKPPTSANNSLSIYQFPNAASKVDPNPSFEGSSGSMTRYRVDPVVSNRRHRSRGSSRFERHFSGWNGFRSSISSLQSKANGKASIHSPSFGVDDSISLPHSGAGPSPLSSPRAHPSSPGNLDREPLSHSPLASKFIPAKQEWESTPPDSSSKAVDEQAALFSLQSHGVELETAEDLAPQRRASTGTGYVPAGDRIEAYRDLDRDESLERKRRTGGTVPAWSSSEQRRLPFVEPQKGNQMEGAGPSLLSLRTPAVQNVPTLATRKDPTSAASPGSATASSTPAATDSHFQLQPVPASKRRKTSHRTQDFNNQVYESSMQARKPLSSGEYPLECDSIQPKTEAKTKLPPEIKVDASSPIQCNSKVKLPPPESSSIATAALPQMAKQEGSPHPGASRSIPRPRLRRSQSSPLLRARTAYDLSLPARHHLVLPAHLAAYLVASQRAAASNNTGRNLKSSSSSRGRWRQITSNPSFSSETSKQTFIPSLHPPFTRQTLRELDLAEILQNPQLRHDIVFDHNVQFRPNFDGDRGGRKREAGDRYWTSIAREIELGCTCTRFEGARILACECGTAEFKRPSRIPLLVHELRAICLLILPGDSNLRTPGLSPTASTPPPSPESAFRASSASHHQLIVANLDPYLISQEMAHGVLDVGALIKFLGGVLKLHCAPLRDEAIEKMIDVVCKDGNISRGLRMCFEILELMKLDIANHQLRSTRPFLVDTAVEFETLWFKEQVQSRKISLDRTFFWFDTNFKKVQSSSSSPPASRTETISRAFYSGFLDLIFQPPEPILKTQSSFDPSLASPTSKMGPSASSPSSSSLNNLFASCYPETFQFDCYRLVTFNNDVVDLTIMYMLLLLFRQLSCSPHLLSESQSKVKGRDQSQAQARFNPAAIASNAASLAQRQLESVKSEVWCLVSDATLRFSTKEGTPSNLAPGTMSGREKLENMEWREAMQDVLLQIASRAIGVQMAARDPTLQGSGSSVSHSRSDRLAPSSSTIKLLTSWLDSNLRPKAPLYLLCQSRLRAVVQAFMLDRLSGLVSNSSRNRRSAASPSSSTPTSMSTSTISPPSPSVAGSIRKQMEEDSDFSPSDSGSKRTKLSNGTAAPASASASASTSTSEPRSLPIPRPTFSSRTLDSKTYPTISRPRPHPIRPIGHNSASSSSPITPRFGSSLPPSPRTPISPALAQEREEAILAKNGLEPFAAEVKLFADRVSKVAAFHLRVYRNMVYESRASKNFP